MPPVQRTAPELAAPRNTTQVYADSMSEWGLDMPALVPERMAETLRKPAAERDEEQDEQPPMLPGEGDRGVLPAMPEMPPMGLPGCLGDQPEEDDGEYARPAFEDVLQFQGDDDEDAVSKAAPALPPYEPKRSAGTADPAPVMMEDQHLNRMPFFDVGTWFSFFSKKRDVQEDILEFQGRDDDDGTQPKIKGTGVKGDFVTVFRPVHEPNPIPHPAHLANASRELDIAEPHPPVEEPRPPFSDVDMSDKHHVPAAPPPASGPASKLDYKKMFVDVARLADRCLHACARFHPTPHSCPSPAPGAQRMRKTT